MNQLRIIEVNPRPASESDCSCQGKNESEQEYRQRVTDETTRLFAEMREDQPHDYNQRSSGALHGIPSGAYRPVNQLRMPYGSPHFSDQAARDAEKAHGGGVRKTKGYGLTLLKILGAGGHGIAALVQHKANTGEMTDCVLKLEKSRKAHHGRLAQEEKALTKYKGASHVLQIHKLSEIVKNERTQDKAGTKKYKSKETHESRDKNWNIKSQWDRNFILVEYAASGNLHQWLCKSSRVDKPWPNKALWMLFKCRLVGVGYPPNQHHKANHPDWDPNNPIDEYIPQPGLEPEKTVHFDLDPTNILGGQTGLETNFPTFKIADFGNAEFFSEFATHPGYFTKLLFWICRLRGKRWYYSPEQFDRSWDSMADFVVDNGPNKFVTPWLQPRVAGNYGMHTNVYQIGVIMWCAITRCQFVTPVVEMPYPRMPPGHMTYGGALQHEKFNDVDGELKDAVQRCMMKEPANRPTLEDLVNIIEKRLERGGLESDDEFKQWAQVFFSTPRVPGVAPKRSRPDDDNDDEETTYEQERYSPRQKVGENSNLHMPRLPIRSRLMNSQQQQKPMNLNLAMRGIKPTPLAPPPSENPQQRAPLEPPSTQDVFQAFRDAQADIDPSSAQNLWQPPPRRPTMPNASYPTSNANSFAPHHDATQPSAYQQNQTQPAFFMPQSGLSQQTDMQRVQEQYAQQGYAPPPPQQQQSMQQQTQGQLQQQQADSGFGFDDMFDFGQYEVDNGGPPTQHYHGYGQQPSAYSYPYHFSQPEGQ